MKNYRITQKSVSVANKLICDKLKKCKDLKYGENKTPVKSEQQELLGKIKGLVYAKDILDTILCEHWESNKGDA